MKGYVSPSPAGSSYLSYSKSALLSNQTDEKINDYYCAHCKTKLFNDKDIVKHEPMNPYSKFKSIKDDNAC